MFDEKSSRVKGNRRMNWAASGGTSKEKDEENVVDSNQPKTLPKISRSYLLSTNNSNYGFPYLTLYPLPLTFAFLPNSFIYSQRPNNVYCRHQ